MAVTDIVRTPYRVATSRPAQKTYINTILFLITSTILLGVSIVAYGLFYFKYVPQIGIERVVHLQYGDGPHPYGIVSLSSELISQQPYDIHLSLHVPRSPPNVEAGNFMLSLSLLSPSYTPPLPPTTTIPAAPLAVALESMNEGDILFSSRRPALLTYSSRLVSLSERLATLPLYVLGWRKESETISVPMAELLEFPRGWKSVPGYAMLEIQAGQNIQVYDVHLHFTARFGGLRWLMYNYRIMSALAGIGTFWSASSLFTILSWLLLKTIFASKTEEKADNVKEEQADTVEGKIKDEPATDEEPDLSDTPRTFPTYGRQAPLRYEPKVKDEVEEQDTVLDETAIQPLIAEADDEEDDDVVDYRALDSGLGTSYSEGGGRSSIARRRSKGGKGGKGLS